MNYLFLIGLVIFSSACTNYSPLDNNGSEEESEEYYLELEFYQESLMYEDGQLRSEMLIIMEEIEGGNNEQQGRLEEIQARLAVIEENVNWNVDILARGGIRPGSPPPRCAPDGLEFKPCPMPKSALDNLYLSSDQWQKTIGDLGKIEIFDSNGDLVGRMNGANEVQDTDGSFLQAEIEYDTESASEVRITNLDVREELRITVYQLQE